MYCLSKIIKVRSASHVVLRTKYFVRSTSYDVQRLFFSFYLAFRPVPSMYLDVQERCTSDLILCLFTYIWYLRALLIDESIRLTISRGYEVGQGASLAGTT